MSILADSGLIPELTTQLLQYTFSALSALLVAIYILSTLSTVGCNCSSALLVAIAAQHSQHCWLQLQQEGSVLVELLYDGRTVDEFSRSQMVPMSSSAVHHQVQWKHSRWSQN